MREKANLVMVMLYRGGRQRLAGGEDKIHHEIRLNSEFFRFLYSHGASVQQVRQSAQGN